MPGKIKVSSTFKSVTSVRFKTASGWGTVTKGFIKVAGVWKQWYSIGLRDTFTRTTSGNLGTSESFFSWSALFGTWFANGTQAQSNTAVASGTAGALSYLDIGTPDAITSAGVTIGTGPAFWVTAAGSWWGAVTTSDQTDTTYSYNCNCTCNGHNQTTCNTCTNAGFGTYSCPTTYAATGSTNAVLQGAPNTSSSMQYASAGTANYTRVNLGTANVYTNTTWSHARAAVLSYVCPGGSECCQPLNTRCYQSSQSIAISSCAATYGSNAYNSSSPCTSCYASVNGSNVFVGCCDYYGEYRGCKGYAITTNWTNVGASTRYYYCTVAGEENFHPSEYSCYTPTVTTTYDCSGYSGTIINPADGYCYQDQITSYSCPAGQTPTSSQAYGFLGCYQSVTSYDCVTPYGNGAYLSGGSCYKNVTTYSCPSGGTLSGTTCTIAQTCNNSGTSCEFCGSTTTFISGGTANPSTGAGCDSYGFTCQTCTAGAVVTNYYLQIIYSTSTGAAYSVYSTSSGLSSQPSTIGVTTSGNTATVIPRSSGGTSLGTFTATNTGTKGNNVGIVKSYGNYAQGSTADNFISDQA
jgi:conjugal transfer mating pair stabilization protein TraN